MAVTIRAIRSYLPEAILTNEELAPQVGWTAADILSKTGIAQRHISAPGECTSDLAEKAVRRLLEATGIDRDGIDFLIVCTQTPDYILPATACLVQARVGLSTRCMAFDLNQGCSGFVYSLATAMGLIDGGLAKRGIIVTAETYTKYIHAQDRSVRTLFGDGATATLVETAPGAPRWQFVLGTDGSGASNLIIPAGGTRQPATPATSQPAVDANGNTRAPANLFMNGQEVFSFTLKRVPEMLNDILGQAGLTKEDVDWFVFHQANRFMLDHLRRKLGIPEERMVLFLEGTGNTTSSTIPLALEDSITQGRFKSGQRVLLAGFGVGYSWGACLLQWP
jgi:3-oxoacyl-[acyl-carrier-protein] synthase-3